MLGLSTVYCLKQPDQTVVAYEQYPSRFLCQWPRDASSKPDYRYKYTTVNCIKYKIVWIGR